MTPEMAVEVFLAAESFATNITKESRGILSEAHHLDHGQSLSMGIGFETSIFLPTHHFYKQWFSFESWRISRKRDWSVDSA